MCCLVVWQPSCVQTICPLAVDNISSWGRCKAQRTFTRIEKGVFVLLLPSEWHHSFKVLKHWHHMVWFQYNYDFKNNYSIANHLKQGILLIIEAKLDWIQCLKSKNRLPSHSHIEGSFCEACWKVAHFNILDEWM